MEKGVKQVYRQTTTKKRADTDRQIDRHRHTHIRVYIQVTKRANTQTDGQKRHKIMQQLKSCRKVYNWETPNSYSSDKSIDLSSTRTSIILGGLTWSSGLSGQLMILPRPHHGSNLHVTACGPLAMDVPCSAVVQISVWLRKWLQIQPNGYSLNRWIFCMTLGKEST